MEGEFQDWELLHNSESASVNSPDPDEKSRNFEEIEGDTGGMIRSDYFSLDNQSRYAKADDVSEEGSVDSDNPGWIDPGSETQYGRKNPGEFWSDSSSDRPDECKFGDFDVKNELGVVDNVKSQVGFEVAGEMEAKIENSGKFVSDESKFSDFDVKNDASHEEIVKTRVGWEEFGEIQVQDKELDKYWSDSGGDGLVSKIFGDVEKESEVGFGDHGKKGDELVMSRELDGGNGVMEEMKGGEGNSSGNERVAISSDVKSGGEGEKRSIAWWKVPFEVLKYCVFKVSPVWSFPVAAAVMGLVILGHKLYKMKRKTRGLQLKVTVDDKFMSRASRLNEAFSVVRRVPIIRPSLPAAGVSPWPLMSLR